MAKDTGAQVSSETMLIKLELPISKTYFTEKRN